MNYIKITFIGGNKALVNLDQVTHFRESNENEIRIFFANESSIVASIPLHKFEQIIESVTGKKILDVSAQ